MHLNDFTALEALRLSDAMDMDLLVRSKPFREEKEGGFINDVDSDEEKTRGPDRPRSEFLGGGGESDCSEVEVEETEGDPTLMRQALRKLDLEASKAMLRREAEVQRACAPGRHKEADTQMKSYASSFGAVLKISAADVPQEHVPPKPSTPLHVSANFQRAMAQEMQTEQAPNRNEEIVEMTWKSS